ncbi:hypothetical protein B0H16DRAFT_794448 [Mycena metata]|uniref:BCS1 N-terminal domain-containing protein n=1 Tax=Mycena metata TaxID=1033252 RepID=A0AAD7NA82_9AGAR|nr:hypothetical protein B0H16DRAFT_794448 [Mycena metata]
MATSQQRRQITTSRHFIRSECTRIRRHDGHPPLVNGSFVIDGMKIVVLGGTVETARRVSTPAWNHFVNSFFKMAHFSEEEHLHGLLTLWLSRRPEWQRSRDSKLQRAPRTRTPLRVRLGGRPCAEWVGVRWGG